MPKQSEVASPIALAEIFPPDAIVLGLRQRDKRGVIDELVQHLVALGFLVEKDANAVVEGILAQEKLGTTALGNGIAFPHCRSSLTDRFIGVLGIDAQGIP